MKEYKILTERPSKAEYLMNEMASKGWEVLAVNYWNKWRICLVITFVRDKQ